MGKWFLGLVFWVSKKAGLTQIVFSLRPLTKTLEFSK